jgi:hypothetical protein
MVSYQRVYTASKPRKKPHHYPHSRESLKSRNITIISSIHKLLTLNIHFGLLTKVLKGAELESSLESTINKLGRSKPNNRSFRTSVTLLSQTKATLHFDNSYVMSKRNIWQRFWQLRHDGDFTFSISAAPTHKKRRKKILRRQNKNYILMTSLFLPFT